MRRLFIILLLIFIAGCTSTSKRINRQLAERNLAYIEYFHKAKVNPLKHRVILIGDNQFNNIHTDPTLLRNSYADHFAEVSIRPPQLDIFSPQLFDWTLKKYNAKDSFVVHLGDALNIGCLNEWQKFRKSLNGVDREKFVMAIGNHDIFWYGVTDGQYGYDRVKWARACEDSYPIKSKDIDDGKRFTKGRFINRYLEFIPINYAKDTTGYFYNNNRDRFVQEVFVQRYRTHKDEYSSFLVQKINIPSKSNRVGLKGIVIDTVTYDKRPLDILGHLKIGGHYNSGEVGGIGTLQESKISKWANEFKSKKEPFMIFGHHPIRELTPSDKRWIEKFLEENPYALGYISAHTHLSFVDTKGHIEINVGSITDYPNEIRFLEVNPVRGELKAIIEPITLGALDNSKKCDSDYDYTAIYPDNYLSYQFSRRGLYSAHYTHEATLNISITTYLRLFDDLGVIRYFYNNRSMVDEYEKIVEVAERERETALI